MLRVIAIGALASIGFAAPAEARPQAAFIGDSYTVGSAMGGKGARGWPAIVSRTFNWKVRMTAQGGTGYYYAPSGLETFEQRTDNVIRYRPKYVFVFGSRNESNSVKVASASLRTLRKLKRALPRARVFVIGPPWVNGNPPEYIRTSRDAIRSNARKVRVRFIDPLADGWFADAQSESYIGRDGVHPDDDGHRYMAANITSALRKFGVKRAR